jgi:hypothetical protein
VSPVRFPGTVLGVLFVVGGLGCESPPPAPLAPTWVDDVLPIVRANCFHCHGSFNRAGLAFRWDFYDPTDTRLTAIRDVVMDYRPLIFFGAKSQKDLIYMFASRTADGMPPLMPPPPATPLDDRELLILKRWMEKPERGTRQPNLKPTATWLSRPTTIVVADEDREQVLGKVSCVGGDEPILYTGATTLSAGRQPPCTATLFDGQDVVTVQLP